MIQTLVKICLKYSLGGLKIKKKILEGTTPREITVFYYKIRLGFPNENPV